MATCRLAQELSTLTVHEKSLGKFKKPKGPRPPPRPVHGHLWGGCRHQEYLELPGDCKGQARLITIELSSSTAKQMVPQCKAHSHLGLPGSSEKTKANEERHTEDFALSSVEDDVKTGTGPRPRCDLFLFPTMKGGRTPFSGCNLRVSLLLYFFQNFSLIVKLKVLFPEKK